MDGRPNDKPGRPAFFERMRFSNLANAGLQDLATHTHDAYADTAIALAADPERRRALRHNLRHAIRTSPLGDTRTWVRDFAALTIRTLESTPVTTPEAAS